MGLEGYQRNLSRNSRVANVSENHVMEGAQRNLTGSAAFLRSQLQFQTNRCQINQTMTSCEAIGTEMAMSRNLRRQDTQSELTLAASKIAKISKLTSTDLGIKTRSNNGNLKNSTISSKSMQPGSSGRSHPSLN